MRLSILGPEKFRATLTDHLVNESHTVLAVGVLPTNVDQVSDAHFAGQVDAHVVVCDGPDNWNLVAELAPAVPTVAVIDTFELDFYIRALALGAGVVHADTPPATIANVIEAAINGEALVPIPVATVMARHEPPGNRQMTGQSLTTIEAIIAAALLDGQSNRQIANRTNYSDRTVRRRLQGIYLKLGVSTRAGAIEQLRARADSDSATSINSGTAQIA